MKVKSLIFAALAASFAFTSCSSDENPPVVDNGPKSVTLSLANVQPVSKSPGAAIADQSNVALSNLQVFFSDGTNLYKAMDATGKVPADSYYSVAAFNASDKTFHFLPSSVNKVIVIGNNGSAISATTEAQLEKELAIADEQTPGNLSLYAEQALTQVSGTDDEGHPLYEASVTLQPRVSRIEIAGFEYQPTIIDGVETREYESLQIQQVMLNNYYLEASRTTGLVVSGNDKKVAPAVTSSTIFSLFSNAAEDWHNDVFVAQPADGKLPIVSLSDGAWAYNYDADALRPAYNFFCNATDVAQTQLLVRLVGSKNNGAESEPLYLATNGFSTPIDVNAGTIYVVSFKFNDSDLANPQKCVAVTVDVKKWNVVAVTPEF